MSKVIEYGDIESDSACNDGLSDIRADISQNVNGRRIEVRMYQLLTVVTVDGVPFHGTFLEAFNHCSKLPIRWGDMFS